MQKVTTPKQVQVIRTWMFNKIDRVCFQVRSSKGEDVYHTCFDKGHASCTCPAGAKSRICYHVMQLRPRYEAIKAKREAERNESKQQVSTPAAQQFEEGQEVVYSYCSGVVFTGIIVGKRTRLNGEDGYMLQTKLWTEVVPVRFLTNVEQVAAVEEREAAKRAAFVAEYDPCMVA